MKNFGFRHHQNVAQKEGRRLPFIMSLNQKRYTQTPRNMRWNMKFSTKWSKSNSHCSWKWRSWSHRAISNAPSSLFGQTEYWNEKIHRPVKHAIFRSKPIFLSQWIFLFTVSVWTLNRAPSRCRCMWIKIINRTFFAMHLGIGKVYIASGRKRSWFTKGVRIDAECPSSGNQ